MTTILCLATLDTPHYRFTALGTTEQEARGILGTGWQRHERLTGAPMSWDDIADDVNVTALVVGVAYRDGSPIAGADTWTSASRQHFIDTGAYLPAVKED